MTSAGSQSVHDRLLEEPSVQTAPFQAIHRCLEHIWQQLHLRAHLFVRKGEELILEDYVGTYACWTETGLKVHPRSAVWEVFRQGKAVNLTEVNKQEKRPRTLPEPVAIKAVILLPVLHISNDVKQTVGALVVDAGDSPEPIEDRDSHYLQVVGMLISEILERFILLRRIQEVQDDRKEIADRVAHIVRNRFTVIGGFARRLAKIVWEPEAQQWAEIILEEVERGAESVHQKMIVK
ncbi:MAG: hypothetical protein JSU72_10950 [Deltaproteobacteria bacterium]|nr:MAG: hypothetical protein JSU72_10950 [Deltaproteobacteria bacterium]